MDTNIFKVGLVFFVIQILLSSGCKKEGTKPCTNITRYSFEATSDFSPQQEVYNVGDTIFFYSSIPKTLTDLITNQQVDYNNSVGVGGNLIFYYLDTISHTFIDAKNRFTTIPYNGTFEQIANSPNLGLNIFYQNAATYLFKIGIVLNERGIFLLGPTNPGSRGLSGKDCTNAGFNMTVTNTNKNLQLFEYVLGYPPDVQQEKVSYCFRVQ